MPQHAGRRSVPSSGADVRYPQEIHGYEDGIRAEEGDPEVHFAQAFVHHPPEHLGEREMGGGVDRGDGFRFNRTACLLN